MTKQNLRDALFAWVDSNAQLTSRIKELAIEADESKPMSVAHQAALDAAAEAIRRVRSARAQVTQTYEDLHVTVPQEFQSDRSA